MVIFSDIEGFEWDDSNRDKNLKKHSIPDAACEEVFFDEQKKIYHDELHPGAEDRFIILGKTTSGGALFVVFTIRNRRIRVISVRPLNKKEQKLYE